MAELKGTKVTIEGVERTVKFTMQAHRIASRNLGVPVRDALKKLRALDVDTLCELAAAGLTCGRPKLSKEIVSADKVALWLEKEPKLITPLMTAVANAIGESFERMFMGEASADDVAAAASKAELDAATSTETTTLSPSESASDESDKSA